MHSVPTFEELVATVVTQLRRTGIYVAQLDARAEAEIANLRKAGRRAGHELGWKVQTLVSEPHSEDPVLRTVHVVVNQDVPELRAVRARQMRAAVQAAARPGVD
jgi:hypothetical protein